MKNSKFLSLGYSDFLKGILLATLTPVMALLVKYFDSGVFELDWILIGRTALGGMCAYLLKNFLTNSSGEFFSKEDIGGGGIRNPKP